MAVRNHLAVAIVVFSGVLGLSALGAPVVGAHDAGHDHVVEQSRAAEPAYVIANPGTGLVLDVRHDVEVFLAEPDDSASQQWVLTDRGRGALTARNVDAGRCLDVPNDSADRWVSLRVWDCQSGAAQGWTLHAVSESTAVLTSTLSGHSVAIPHWAKGAGARVVQDLTNESEAQQWGFVPVSAPAAQTALAVEAPAETTDDSELSDTIVRTFFDVRDYWDRVTETSSSVGFILFSEEKYENSCLGAVYEVAYCSTDDVIFMNADSAARWAEDYGTFTLSTIVAHEYGHNMQEEIGGVERGPERELQADCFAGAWAADANRRDWTRPGDFQRTIEFFAAIGGPGHGTGDQRRDAILYGWMNGAQACRINWR